MNEADEPDAVGDLLDADQLAGEHGAQVDFAALVADTASVRDQVGSVIKRILEIAQSLVGPGRFYVVFRGHLHVQRLVRPFGAVVIDEVIEMGLLHQEVLGGGPGGFASLFPPKT